MKTINISLIAAATLFMTACGSGETADKKSTEEAAPVEKSTEVVCQYSYDESTTKLTWTSFKTSAKVAVGGSFDTYSVSGTEPSNSEAAVFQNATFSIVTGSVNSGNTERDPKLVNFFFNTMVDSDTITGGIRKISEAVDGKGAAIIYIKMNGIERDVNATYTILGTELTLSATIDVANWDATNAITALNTECKDLHTGDDGVSKLWSEVSIEIYTNLAKTCE